MGQTAQLCCARSSHSSTDLFGPWVAWNVVRAVAATLAFGCLAWVLMLHGRLTGVAVPDRDRPLAQAALIPHSAAQRQPDTLSMR